MSPFSIGVLAVSMSVDAFAASVGKGVSARRPGFGNALRTGMIFGAVEAITPLLGWAAGMAASQYVAQVDHWIAFALLGAVGLHMILQARTTKEGEGKASTALWPTILTAIGTSVDAMAIGVSLAFLNVNILVVALAIGFATMVMSSTGMLAGHYLGQRFGRVAEAVGGCALIGIGAVILFEHLTTG